VDEKELVRRLKSGDKDAFDALYEKYKNILLRMAYLVSGQMFDAEDIVQETFVKCYLHIGELKKEEGFRPWLFQILYRTAYRQAKKRKREIPEEDIAIRADATDGVTSLDRIIETENERLVNQTVQSLEFKHRAVVVLHYYNEMATKEIARVLGCTEGTVKSRLFAARKKLRGKLAAYGEGGRGHENDKNREDIRGLYFL
jgi:RNA polymerase sigma-70 factor (ECF subfamily)